MQLPLLLVSFAALAAIAGCNGKPAVVDRKLTETPSVLVEQLLKTCFGENVLGREKLVAFLGPNSYSPGDLWSRVQAVDGRWIYNPMYGYEKTVGPKLYNDVVEKSATAVSCEIKVERNASADAKLEALFTASAVPAKAKGGFDFKNGAVTSMKVDKAYLDTIKTFPAWKDSWVKNPAISPQDDGLKAVLQGTAYVSSAMLRVNGYTVEVQYGSNAAAGLGASATLLGGEKEDLSAEVNVSKKNDNKLVFKVEGEVKLAAIFRQVGPGGEVLSGASGTGTSTELSFGEPKRRGGYLK
jgi:hypothetical protein